jgi:hypothetical protein
MKRKDNSLLQVDSKVRESVEFDVEVSAKSYIKEASCSNICRFGWFDPGCKALAAAWCEGMGPMGVVCDTDEEYGRDGKYRLWSKVTFTITCDGDAVTSVVEKDRDSHTGTEGPFQAPDGSFRTVKAFVDDEGVGHVGYFFSGRPPLAIEPSFQAIRVRKCPFIWHYPYIKMESCSVERLEWYGHTSIGGSNFPTRRWWTGPTQPVEIIEQGDIEELWHCESFWHDDIVVGSWPFGLGYD